MVITMVIIVSTISERQISTFPIVLATVSLVQDSIPLRFLCELKRFAKVCSHISSHMAKLLGNFCIVLLFAFMAQALMMRSKL